MSVTVDIEDWYHNPAVCGSPFSIFRDEDQFFEQWTGRYDYISEPVKKVLKIMDDFHIRATFFVVADVVERYPGLVESIVDRGHEIECHGLQHSCKIHNKTKEPLMTVSEFKERTLKAKRMLEKVSGEKVTGYRAPNAYVAGWMLDALRDIGFEYDSSVCVNSLYNKTNSRLAGVSSYPYYPDKNSLEPGEAGDFLEFPWAYYEAGIKIPTSGGPMLRFLTTDILLGGLKQSLKRGHTILYFHPLDISDEKLPKLGRGRPFFWINKGDIVEKRIRHILGYVKGNGVDILSPESAVA